MNVALKLFLSQRIDDFAEILVHRLFVVQLIPENIDLDLQIVVGRLDSFVFDFSTRQLTNELFFFHFDRRIQIAKISDLVSKTHFVGLKFFYQIFVSLRRTIQIRKLNFVFLTERNLLKQKQKFNKRILPRFLPLFLILFREIELGRANVSFPNLEIEFRRANCSLRIPFASPSVLLDSIRYSSLGTVRSELFGRFPANTKLCFIRTRQKTNSNFLSDVVFAF